MENDKQIFIEGEFSKWKEIGYGIDAVVSSAVHNRLGTVAVKKYHSQGKYSKREIFLLPKVKDNDHIVRLFGFLHSNDNRTIIGCVLELMTIGSLGNVIHSREEDQRFTYRYNEKLIYFWIESITKGLEYIHSLNIIHRDIKPANLLLGQSLYDLKIADFGYAREINLEMLSGTIGTFVYMAPEVIKGEKDYDSRVDIYSLCISIVEMANRNNPWKEIFPEHPIGYSFLQAVLQNKRPWFRKYLDSALMQLVKLGWDTDRRLRPTLAEFAELAAKLQKKPLIKSVPKGRKKMRPFCPPEEDEVFLTSVREIDESLEDFLVNHYSLLEMEQFNRQISGLKTFCERVATCLSVSEVLILGELPIAYNFLIDLIPNYSKKGTRLFGLTFIESNVPLLTYSMRNSSLSQNETPILPRNIVELCAKRRKEQTLQKIFFNSPQSPKDFRRNVLLIGENDTNLESALIEYKNIKNVPNSYEIVEFGIHSAFKTFSPKPPLQLAKEKLRTAVAELGNVFTICSLVEAESIPWYLELMRMYPKRNVLVLIFHRTRANKNKATEALKTFHQDGIKWKYFNMKDSFSNSQNIWRGSAVEVITTILSHARDFQTPPLR